MAEGVGQHDDLTPARSADFGLREGARGQGPGERGVNVVNCDIKVVQGPIAVIPAQTIAGPGYAGGLFQKIDPRGPAAQFDALAAEPAGWLEAERST